MKKYLHPKGMLPFAACAGFIGFVLRLWLFATGTDQKGLLKAAHPGNAMTLILTAMVLAVLLLWLRLPLKKIGHKRLFPRSLPAAVGCWIAAAGILITDIHELTGQFDRFSLLSGLCSVAAVAALVFLGLNRLHGHRSHPALHGGISMYLMIHLISQYRFWSAETQLQVFFFQLLASVFLMLATYHRATVDAGFGKLPVYLFFRYGGIFLCCLAAYGQLPLFYLTTGIWLATTDCRPIPGEKSTPLPLPKEVAQCLHMLHSAGYASYAVGGCVRDMLLGLTPQDYDICTAATPEQTAEVFADYQLVRSGEKHGTIGVVMDGKVYEITTFRTEGGYSDSRHPDWVEFVPNVKEDLARRDFTVNAMAYSPEKGLIDPFGGQADLKAQVLRTVGDPTARFTEDALRILRGVRFAARYQLTPHPDTLAAMLELSASMEHLARERVFSELCKLLPVITATDLLRYSKIITQVIPELAPAVGFQQHTSHHIYDVYTHTAYVVENTPPELTLRLAALLHDVGKPAVFTMDEQGNGHFYDHAAVGADMTDEILTRLRAPTALRQQVVLLIRQHMAPIAPEAQLLRRRLARYGESTLRQLLALQKADRAGKGIGEDLDTEPALHMLDEILAQENCFSLRDLAVNGNDLLEAGFQPGPQIGTALNTLLSMVVDQQLPNEKDALLKAALTLKEENP